MNLRNATSPHSRWKGHPLASLFHRGRSRGSERFSHQPELTEPEPTGSQAPHCPSASHTHTATDWGNPGTVAGAYGPELKTRAGREGHPGGRGSVSSCQLVTWPTAADRVGLSSRYPPPLPLPSLPSPSRASLRFEAQTRGMNNVAQSFLSSPPILRG